MTLDDRSLREHLERRAKAGATDVDALGDAVVAQLSDAPRRSPWHRRLRIGPRVGLAAAALVVALLGISLIPGALTPGPGASASATPGTSPSTSTPPSDVPALEYPAGRAMTAGELGALLGETPSDRASIIVIADVELLVLDLTCVGTCPRYLIRTATRDVRVFATDDRLIAGAGSMAFRVRADGDLDLLQAVRAGPDGLAWTLPQLTEELAKVRAFDRAVRYVYLVDAVRAVSQASFRCLAPSVIDLKFGCGTGDLSWLVPVGTSVSSLVSAPPGSLRVPNVTGISLEPGDTLHERGFWLLDPWVTPDDCFMCPTAGAADLLGRVLSFP